VIGKAKTTPYRGLTRINADQEELPKTPRLPKTAKIENQKLTAENAEGAEKDLKVKTECLGRTPYGFFLKEGSAEILRHALNSLRRFARLRMTRGESIAVIAVIAVIARDRKSKNNTLPRINTDKRGSKEIAKNAETAKNCQN
jgi:hypothetical protein